MVSLCVWARNGGEAIIFGGVPGEASRNRAATADAGRGDLLSQRA